ncbi:hypothetical protein [Cellvibrio sp.]|uniref:hypothetical protein n=1 Tax=Cellvibrio sp. TaxID=1965322 RepID=UPI003964898D
MNIITSFQGHAELTAQQNLEKFIQHAKQNCPLDNVDWNSDIWDVTEICKKGYQGKGKAYVYFKSATDTKNSTKITTPLQEPFKSFAKATFSEYLRKYRPVEYKRPLYALQTLEQALIHCKQIPCITNLSTDVLDTTSIFLKERYQDPWLLGKQLEKIIINFIEPARLSNQFLDWKSPFKYKTPTRSDRVNSNGNHEKLPSVQTILALAEIHNSSLYTPDKITTSWVCLAMHAPSRVTEILSLSVKCVVQAQGPNQVAMGLRWHPIKGGQPITKFALSDNAAALTQSAINYLIDIGANARKAASWYELNPGQLYLPEGFEHLRDQPLTLCEITKILGRRNLIKSSFAAETCKFINVGLTTDKSRFNEAQNTTSAAIYCFKSVERWVNAQLPKSFPIICKASNLKYSDALFTLPKNIFRPRADTLEYVPDTVSVSQINHQLGAHPAGLTVFFRNNKIDEDGNPLEITSHQFRHFLNTLAQSKYLNQSLIALWSGRRDVSQNKWYNHVPQEAFIEAYRLLQADVPEPAIEGPLNEKTNTIADINLITKADAIKHELGAIHVTRYGLCRHDYSLTPCPKDKDCINCGEHLFTKGDRAQLEEAETQLQLLQNAVRIATEALENGEPGVERWLELNRPKLERWKLAVQKLKDPNIKDSTLISLPKVPMSQTKTGLAFEIAMQP